MGLEGLHTLSIGKRRFLAVPVGLLKMVQAFGPVSAHMAVLRVGLLYLTLLYITVSFEALAVFFFVFFLGGGVWFGGGVVGGWWLFDRMLAACYLPWW